MYWDKGYINWEEILILRVISKILCIKSYYNLGFLILRGKIICYNIFI